MPQPKVPLTRRHRISKEQQNDVWRTENNAAQQKQYPIDFSINTNQKTTDVDILDQSQPLLLETNKLSDKHSGSFHTDLPVNAEHSALRYASREDAGNDSEAYQPAKCVLDSAVIGGDFSSIPSESVIIPGSSISTNIVIADVEISSSVAEDKIIHYSSNASDITVTDGGISSLVADISNNGEVSSTSPPHLISSLEEFYVGVVRPRDVVTHKDGRTLLDSVNHQSIPSDSVITSGSCIATDIVIGDVEISSSVAEDKIIRYSSNAADITVTNGGSSSLVADVSNNGEVSSTTGSYCPVVRPRDVKTHEDGITVLDSVDHPPHDTKEISYTYVDILLKIISIVSYLFDVGSDIHVAVIYYKDCHWWWFGLTVSFIVLPSITITGFSLAWYLQDRDSNRGDIVKHTRIQWVSRLMLVFLQLGPIIRYIDAIIYGWRSRQAAQTREERLKWHWYKEMLLEDTDSSLLRLIECFMEAIPQFTLQLYIFNQLDVEENIYLAIAQAASVLTSLCSIVWALTSYQRTLRLSLDDKANLTWRALSCIFAWRILTVTSRIFVLALFTSSFGQWVFVIVFLHFGIMLIWILLQKTKFCSSNCREFFFSVVVAAISIFCYFNLVEGHTRLRCLFYYTIVYAENVGMFAGWYIAYGYAINTWELLIEVFFVLISMPAGILIQVIYYLQRHPNNQKRDGTRYRPVRAWIPLKELWEQDFSKPSKNNVIFGQATEL